VNALNALAAAIGRDAMRKLYLYRILFPDGRHYIGISDQQPPQKRFAQHHRADTLVGHAIRHYGLHNCLVEVLSAGARVDIGNAEGRAISFHNTRFPAGYNYAPRPDSAEGRAWFLERLKDLSPQWAVDQASGLDMIFTPAMSFEKRPNCGWIEMTANRKGMRTIEYMFPGLVFDWKRLRRPWDGRWSTVAHLPSLAAKCGYSLRSELIALIPLQSLNDAELASLMACATYEEGVHAAWRPSEGAGVHPFFRNMHAHAG
jgi:hypothetical protein